MFEPPMRSGDMLTPNGLLHLEVVRRENLGAAMSVLFAAFPDEQSRAQIRTVFGAYVRGEVSYPSLVYSSGTIEIKEQFLYRDRAGNPVAVGGLYKESDR